jgi:hypothetical protein
MAEPERKLSEQDLLEIKQDWSLADRFEVKSKQDAQVTIAALLNEIRYYNYWNENYKSRLAELGQPVT